MIKYPLNNCTGEFFAIYIVLPSILTKFSPRTPHIAPIYHRNTVNNCLLPGNPFKYKFGTVFNLGGRLFVKGA